MRGAPAAAGAFLLRLSDLHVFSVKGEAVSANPVRGDSSSVMILMFRLPSRISLPTRLLEPVFAQQAAVFSSGKLMMDQGV